MHATATVPLQLGVGPLGNMSIFYILYVYFDVFITYIVSIDGICEHKGGNDSNAGIATHVSHFCHSLVTMTSVRNGLNKFCRYELSLVFHNYFFILL